MNSDVQRRENRSNKALTGGRPFACSASNIDAMHHSLGLKLKRVSATAHTLTLTLTHRLRIPTHQCQDGCNLHHDIHRSASPSS
mmetsp:Transcript_4878/g.13216  ORF Transcript_4878/g.13216 Transcript_4878/m.13216 type:complete len:84 (+) Transcript_4878:1523-1774(+)